MGARTMRIAFSLPMIAIAATACASVSHGQIEYAPPPMSYAGYPSHPVYPVGAAPARGEESREQSASLWETTPTALLSMRRAKEVGDLLTVVVEMDDRASLQNSLSRNRSANEDMSLDAFLGLTDWMNGVLPGSNALSPGMQYDRSSSLTGQGAVNRAEKVTFTLAARVVGVEPNGNLIIHGYQETRVSNEIRYLTVSGVVRAQDITRTNTVSYEKIADARMAYISNGDASSAAERKALPRKLDKALPF